MANAHVTQSDADHRKKSLKTANNSSDSIKILLDVYNLSNKVNKDKIRAQIINMASRSDNHEVISEVVKELSTSTDDAEELGRLIEISENLPEGHKSETLKTVLHMEQANAESSSLHDSQIEHQIIEFSRQNLSLTGDPYKEIQNIYKTMVYLGTASQGPMYFEYIKRLEELVEALPENDHSIRNLYYTTAALYYTRKRDYKKAIEFDRKLIKELDKIREAYIKDGKTPPDLDYFYYVSYRRMLRNFRGLTPQQIQYVYDKCVELSEKNDDAREAFGTGGLTNSYYYFATKQFPLAIPELKKALNSHDISKFRRQELLGLLAKSYYETGNKEGELETLREYILMMIDDRTQLRNNMYREIELRNSVNKMIAEEYKIQESQREENRVMRKTSITLVYVLAVVLIFLCSAYLRLRQRVKELEIKNNKLRTNIEHIFDDGVPKGTKDIHHQKNRLKG